ncbi:plasmid mobilization relaxosome protein MobC [Streptosporangium sp. NPDC002544]|uniref:plasmid mobilization relaxosome protein MobC n=1 Tax=Streptosporangium sp. NPDC002544 TaxID=3154538 RepID=UPI00332C1A26
MVDVKEASPPEPGPRPRSGGRRRRVAGGRGNRHTVRFTDAGQHRVEGAAAAAGMSVPNLLAETMPASLAQGDRLMTVAECQALAREITAAQRVLRAIGNNVNQLAAKANTGQAPAAAEVGATMHAVRRATHRIDLALAQLIPERPEDEDEDQGGDGR